MARLRRLPVGVTPVIDRHGKERFRYRRKGMDFYIPHPDTPEGKAILKAAAQGVVPRKTRVIPKTIGDLFERFYASAKFNRGGEAWRATVRATLEEFRNEAKDIPVADFTDAHIETILVRRAKKRVVGKRVIGGPAAATRLHEQLIRLFDYAQSKQRWIDRNPAREAESPVAHKSKGYHSWTEEEIEQFQARHPIGTKARLALEIALWTGLRRGDVAKLGPTNIIRGRLTAIAGKTEKGVNVIVAPDLEAAIAAVQSGDTFLTTSQGKPFSDAGLGNWFRERCDEAGLPHCSIHGLRKALARRAAEADATQQQIKALGQWSDDAEVTTYTAAANQKKLADEAIRRVIEARTLSNLTERLDK